MIRRQPNFRPVGCFCHRSRAGQAGVLLHLGERILMRERELELHYTKLPPSAPLSSYSSAIYAFLRTPANEY